jgi:hypothetical protein
VVVDEWEAWKATHGEISDESRVAIVPSPSSSPPQARRTTPPRRRSSA